jgi:uncharacterized protein (DUF1800 family)
MKLANLADSQHFQSRIGIGSICSQVHAGLGKDSLSQLESQFANPDLNVSAPTLTPLEQVVSLLGSIDKKPELIKLRRQESNQLLLWWLQQLHHTKQPLLERMTLFWHNHFTSSASKVQWPQLVYRQHLLLRHHALGNFADMLRDICSDPAMLIYLDAGKNVAEQPNENFARELLELFTLGEGHYSENDIISAARAFTGKRYVIKKDEVVFAKKLHDAGQKNFLGKTGNFDADDIAQIILEHPRTAEFIAEKFWLNFVNPDTPEKNYIKEWAKAFRESGYQIKTLLTNIIQSPVFWKKENRGAFIKSPIEFTVGLLRELGLEKFRAYPQLKNLNSRLGQRLFYPPDVKGWRGGDAWLDNGSFVIRQNFIRQIIHDHMDMVQLNNSPQQTNIDSLSTCLLPLAPIHTIDPKQTFEDQLLALLSDPVYQLR